MTKIKHPPTLDVAEVAELWDLSQSTIYRLARTGELPVQPLRVGVNLRWPRARVYATLGLDEDGNLLDHVSSHDVEPAGK